LLAITIQRALHRVRSRLIGQRTAVINQIRGFLLEHGIALRQGLRFLRQQRHPG
jgi:transposase